MRSCGNLKLNIMKLDEIKLQEVVEKIAYQQHGQEQIDDLYAKMGILNEYVQEQLRLYAAVGQSEQLCWQCECREVRRGGLCKQCYEQIYTS